MSTHQTATYYPGAPRPNGSMKRYFTMFFVALAGVSVAACLVLNQWGPLFLTLFLALAIIIPLLLQFETGIFYAWLFLFPFMHYDPFHLGGLFHTPSNDYMVPIFLVMTLPGACVSLVTRWSAHRRLLPVTIPLWFMVMGFLTNVFREDAFFHFDYFVRDFLGVLVILYLLVVGYRFIQQKPQNWAILYRWMFGLGFLNGLVIIVEYLTHHGLIVAGDFERPMGLFGFPVVASLIAMTTMVLALYRYFTATTGREKLWYGFSLILLAIGCFMTLTKTNIIQLLPLLGVWALFLPTKLKLRALGTFLILTIIFLLWEGFWDHGELLSVVTTRFSHTDTLQIRESVWHLVLENLTWPTILWGKGWYSSSQLISVHNYNYRLFPATVRFTSIHPHNAYLKYVYDMGLLGAGVMLSYIVLMLRGFWGALRKSPPQQRLANLAIASVLMIILVNSITGLPMCESYTLLNFSCMILLLAFPAGWIRQELPSSKQ